jgi:DNA-binding LacI/PurR family transcriptional regulator
MADTTENKKYRTVTLKDIAKHCGFGVGTVSMALRDNNAFPPATTDAILTAAAELGYDPSRQQNARRLVMSRFGKRVLNHLIALFVPKQFYRAAYYTGIFDGIMEVMNEEGFGLMTVNASPGGLDELPPSFNRGEIDGVISVVGWQASQDILQHTRRPSPSGPIPMVSMLAALPDCSTVISDARGGAIYEVEHLLKLGHRHFAYFRRPGGEPFGFHQDQLLSGNQQAITNAGLHPDTHLHPVDIDPILWSIAFIAADITNLYRLDMMPWSKQHPLLELLKSTQQITAILAPNDPAAVVIRHILQVSGYRVPDDISLVGFDDTDPLWDSTGQNILTTVSLPLHQLGRRAAKLIIEQATTSENNIEKIVLPVELVVRGSTGGVV